MPKLSWMTLAKGARQLVVQEALLRKKGKYQPEATLSRERDEIPSSWSKLQAREHPSPYLTIFRDLSYFSWFTPITNMGASAEGAEMMTRLAPPFR